ncbi:T9SS type A sorting domain-containing protein [Algibacter luteus]|uniref:Por secretion system C-terminal sorting domain-containing protein n=1 Tax=Algibacter luteus TaxID=1178825 RepID=A0A1M6DD99_9FLAO|nr:T9SS type A sorting domain-containing protein [Algibacter luteus]SHI71169.1 Por secretion system C-terminal sorting domain-containing protein [Algibacter luteus]
MKKMILIYSLFCVAFGFSQTGTNYAFTFEEATNGSDITYWNVFEGDTPAIEVVTNPNPNGVNNNATTKVLKLNVLTGNACYAGAETQHGTVGVWALDASTTTLSMMVHKSTIGRIGIKFVGEYDGFGFPTIFELTAQTNTLINQWELLTWDISSYAPSSNIDQIVIFSDFTCGDSDRNSDSVTYVDNIEFTANKIADPILPNYITSWNKDFETVSGFIGADNATFSEIANPETGGTNPSATSAQLEGINAMLYSNAQFTFGSLDYLDFSANNKGFSLKVRGPRAVPVKLKVEVDGAGQEIDANYTDVGNWQTLFFDFSAYNSRTWNRVVLFFDITGSTSTNTSDDIFLFDDITFDVFTSLSTKDNRYNTFSSYPNPTQNSWTIKSDNGQIISIKVFDVLGNSIFSMAPNSIETKIDGSRLNSGLYFAQIQTDTGTSTLKLVKK